ncbi:MAG: helix-turn-helix domain containing protein [Actinobacteria bacterium]|nr:helix-turn-helix domain containing protein [Actinomycetota bacterium]
MTEEEILRNQKWRLGVIRHAEEVTGNVAETCRYFGISRTIYYRWYRKYKKYGIDGLKDKYRPHLKNQKQNRSEIISKIVYLRENYHFGPGKIQMYLERYHNVIISKTAIFRILKELNMNRLPDNYGDIKLIWMGAKDTRGFNWDISQTRN